MEATQQPTQSDPQEAKPTGTPQNGTPAPKTPPSPVSEQKNAELTPWDELDKLANPPEPTPKEEVKDKKAEPPQKQEEPAKVEEEGSKKPEAPVEEKTTTAKELRVAYDNSKKRIQSLETEIAELKKSKPVQDDAEKKTLLERLASEEKKRKEIESELGAYNYEKTEDYRNRFQKPMESAFAFAHQEISQLKIEGEDGTSRAATKEDFNKLLHLNTYDANKIATELFGSAAPEVMAHRRKILELNMDRVGAIKEHAANREKIEQEQAIDRQRQEKAAEELWEKSKKEQIEKYPQYFAPKEGDTEINELLEKGIKVTDLVFSRTEIPMEKRIELTATVRNKAAAFDRLALENKRKADRISELEKELEGYKKSAPSGDDPSTPIESESSWQDEIDSMAVKK